VPEVAKMTLLEFIDSEKGRAAIFEGAERALEEIRKDLPSAVFEGTMLAYNVSVRWAKTEKLREDIIRERITCDKPDPEGGKYDYWHIASRKQDVSIRTGVSMREAMLRGWLEETDVQWIGNTVTFLDKANDCALIVSCSGLSDLGDEAAAELLAANIKWDLLRAYALAA
jgi:hypothetical protein